MRTDHNLNLEAKKDRGLVKLEFPYLTITVTENKQKTK